MTTPESESPLTLAGIPTVGIYIAAFAHVPERMGVSRALITDHPMGRPLGAPGDAVRQRAVVEAALALLTSTAGQTIVSFAHPYRTAPPGVDLTDATTFDSRALDQFVGRAAAVARSGLSAS